MPRSSFNQTKDLIASCNNLTSQTLRHTAIPLHPLAIRNMDSNSSNTSYFTRKIYDFKDFASNVKFYIRNTLAVKFGFESRHSDCLQDNTFTELTDLFYRIKFCLLTIVYSSSQYNLPNNQLSCRFSLTRLLFCKF